MPKDVDLRDLKRIAKEEKEERIKKNRKKVKLVEVNVKPFENTCNIGSGTDY